MYVQRLQYFRPIGRCTVARHYSWNDSSPKHYARLTVQSRNYSWRTGKTLRTALRDNMSLNGVFTPSGSDLMGAISSRRQFIEDQLQQAIVSVPDKDYTSPSGMQLTSDNGHTFWSVKTTCSGAKADFFSQTNQGWINHIQNGIALFRSSVIPSGPWGTSPDYSGFGLPNPLPPSTAALTLRKQGMFNSARPDASVSGVGETLYELFTGQWPKLLTSLGSRIAAGKLNKLGVRDVGKYAGDAYLNSVFQWKPIIEDFMALIRVALAATDLLYGSEYRRQRYTPTEFYPATFMARPGIVSSLGGEGFTSPPQSVEHKLVYSTDSRLSAKFSKAKPGIGTLSMLQKAEEAMQTLGIWTPSLGWDILPYSWLVDWFFHIGRGFENASTYSTLGGSYHVNYAYATHKTTAVTFIPATSGTVTNANGTTKWDFARSTTVDTTLWRERATPWGFGLDLSKLTQSQWQILAALGLARAR